MFHLSEAPNSYQDLGAKLFLEATNRSAYLACGSVLVNPGCLLEGVTTLQDLRVGIRGPVQVTDIRDEIQSQHGGGRRFCGEPPGIADCQRKCLYILCKYF